ncbi:Crp/Fnr family transcriptional regulator [Variovorax sp. MHTC-1]|uniref:Crp/Fnr family transcriptional regulator n=1 Tax=Variovorax sp. MHTC-1 TaxID=2495593 RepID=UPI0026AEDA24
MLILSTQEREAIDADPWFASLSASLRHDILRRAEVRHFADRDAIYCRGARAEDWNAVANGAVRIGSSSPDGRQATLRYVEPGVWFGEVEMFDLKGRPYDASAHGPTTLLSVRREDVHAILAGHTELYAALLRLNSQRVRQLYRLVEDLATKPLRARLAKQLSQLAHSYGKPAGKGGAEVRIALRLAQEELAHLIGCSRQRVNEELKLMERDETIRIEPCCVIVRNGRALRRMYEPAR